MEQATKEITIDGVEKQENSFKIKFSCPENISKFFKQNEFFCEYNASISNADEDILLVPFIANILPILWLNNVRIHVKKLDAAFFYSIPEFKKGYENMFPAFIFHDDVVIADELIKNTSNSKKSLCLFSGGMDAYLTLINVINQKPDLFTVIGSDIPLHDDFAINNLKMLVGSTAKTFELKENYCSSNFRLFLNHENLNKTIKDCGDNYWHAMQHGIGLIALTAPLCIGGAYSKIYIASSFSKTEKERLTDLRARENLSFTCASDPTIDNYIKFCGADVEHNGVEYGRVDKTKIVCEFVKEKKLSPKIHVCWENDSGENCCHCEKCYRTILSILAIGIIRPEQLGFNFDKKFLKNFKKFFCYKMPDDKIVLTFWETIQKSFNTNSFNYNELKWFRNYQLSKFGKSFKRKVYQLLRKIKWKIKRMVKLK